MRLSAFFRKCLVVVTLLGLVAGCTTMTPPEQVLSVPATPGKYAAIVVDARTGKQLFEVNSTAQRYPASLTKMMTLYLVFEALDAGRIAKDTQFPVSAHAASQPPTKMRLKPGETIDVETAIRALAVKSANDVAVAVAEYLGGSEEGFAAAMTAKARQIGMRDTVFRNASGLPDDGLPILSHAHRLRGEIRRLPRADIALARRSRNLPRGRGSLPEIARGTFRAGSEITCRGDDLGSHPRRLARRRLNRANRLAQPVQRIVEVMLQCRETAAVAARHAPGKVTFRQSGDHVGDVLEGLLGNCADAIDALGELGQRAALRIDGDPAREIAFLCRRDDILHCKRSGR